MLVDGADEQKLIKQMNSEITSMKGRHAATTGCVTSWVDIAPAMGMIGTLIGLVLMLGNMGSGVSACFLPADTTPRPAESPCSSLGAYTGFLIRQLYWGVF